MNNLKEAMLLLIGNTGPLSQVWKDRELAGDWAVIVNATSVVTLSPLG